jgi:hypothetical protein
MENIKDGKECFGEKGANPREGIETYRSGIVVLSSLCMREELILVRGLKPGGRRSQ